ncbi:MAG: DNA polymerase I [Armatimonadota bacterium]|nr:DNA polymerase I [Armatimonadota bacterium]
MPETLYLIDGHAQIFRAYYAIRGGMRSARTGEPTHAVYGFAGMLLKLFSQFHPHYVVVAIDVSGKTFRDDLFPEYKGTRNATPEDLTAQVPRILELVELFGVPIVGVPGLEADDVIATITERILADTALNDVNIRIVSKDKDLEQLLGDRVTMFDIHTDTTIDTAWLLENKGIRPEQVVDVLALTGDTVDNVPGVEGVGPKTAAQLIQQFGSVEGILRNLDSIKGKRRENLEAARSRLPLSQQLVTLKRDGDFPFSLEGARTRPIEPARILPLFHQLDFHRYTDEVRRLAKEQSDAPPEEGPSPQGRLLFDEESDKPPRDRPLVEGERAASDPAVASHVTADNDTAGPTLSADNDILDPVLAADNYSNGNYKPVITTEQLQELVTTLRAQPIFSVDCETTGLQRDALICGFSFAWKEGHAVYVPTRSPEPDTHLDAATVIEALRPLLEDAALAKCGHNLKFDSRAMLGAGIRLRGVVFDSFLASTLVDPTAPAHSLDGLAMPLLNYKMIPISELIGSGPDETTIDAAPLDKVVPYAAEDADIALRLYHKLNPKVEAMGMAELMKTAEAPLTMVLAEMEVNGILCDPDELIRQGDGLKGRVAELREEIQRLCGCEFHLDSTSQLAGVLFDKLGLSSGKKTKTGRSTDRAELERLASQEDVNDPRTSVPRLIMEYRQLTKLISTYLGNLRASIDERDGRIHSSFRQLDTATGRLSSDKPNLQNIPIRTNIGRQIRKAFYAPAGYQLICADYSQIELRLLAHLSGDEALLDAFDKDLDIHTAVAAQVFGVSLEAVTREQRNSAKTINFGIIYGVTAFGLARRIEGLTTADATKLIADYKVRFPGIDRFLQQCVTQALEHGWVSTLLGRRRAVPEVESANGRIRALGERIAINSVVQGSAADLIKLAMVNVQRRIDRDRLPLKILLQIHDELVFESPTDRAEDHARIVCEEMDRAMTLRVPLRSSAGIGPDWLTAK